MAIDPDARIELQIRLKELLAERLLAAVSDAYVGAAVTEIAALRGQLFGPQVG